MLSALVLVAGSLRLSVSWEGKGGAPWLAHTVESPSAQR